MHLVSLFFTAVIFNNIVLSKMLGLCPAMGVSNSQESSIGMGYAAMFVTVVAGLVSYGIYHLVLVPLSITFMDLLIFILVIASLVQLVEMIMKKSFPALYKSLGIYLPLITTNCMVLFVALENINQRFDFLETVVYSFGVPIGFALLLAIFAAIRERLAVADVPEAFKGIPIAMITLGIMAIAFSGLAGII
jgi:electron transport complex protein RnfA